MDLHYCWAVLSALIGASAGFQGIYESYHKDAFISAGTTPGALYLLSRAAVPAATFSLLYGTGTIATNLWLWSLVSGTGSEALLRSNFFIKKADVPGPNAALTAAPSVSQDVMFGPLDLLKWWQELALNQIGPYLSGNRLNFVKKHTPKANDFSKLCVTIKDNLLGLQNQGPVPALSAEIDALAAEYKNDATPDLEHYRIGLGLRIERAISRREFVTVVVASSV
jgi:hypothetical protein